MADTVVLPVAAGPRAAAAMVGALVGALAAALAALADVSDHHGPKLTVGGLKNGTMKLVMIPAGEPALAGSCLDGSPYGMYQLLNVSSPNWIIYFDGGIVPAAGWAAAGLARRCLQRQHVRGCCCDLKPSLRPRRWRV